MRLRRGQLEITSGVAGQIERAHQRAHATAVDERETLKIRDDLPPADRESGELSGYSRTVDNVKLSAQGDDYPVTAFAAIQLNPYHRLAFLHEQQGGVPTKRLICRPDSACYSEYPPMSLAPAHRRAKHEILAPWMRTRRGTRRFTRR